MACKRVARPPSRSRIRAYTFHSRTRSLVTVQKILNGVKFIYANSLGFLVCVCRLHRSIEESLWGCLRYISFDMYMSVTVLPLAGSLISSLSMMTHNIHLLTLDRDCSVQRRLEVSSTAADLK